MTKIIWAFYILTFLISCGPSKAELEAKQKQGIYEDSQRTGNTMETQTFYDGEDHHVKVHIVEINGCTWYNFCSPNGNVAVHNPHCNKPIDQ